MSDGTAAEAVTARAARVPALTSATATRDTTRERGVSLMSSSCCSGDGEAASLSPRREFLRAWQKLDAVPCGRRKHGLGRRLGGVGRRVAVLVEPHADLVEE